MMDNDLEKLYDAFLGKDELTTKELNDLGFSSKNLKDLVEDGTIERVKRGVYNLKSLEKMFYYGKKLVSDKKYDKATLYFEKIFSLDKTHMGSCFQLFLRSIQTEDFERTFELYEYLTKTENEFYAIDFNYYLYLLNHITDVPEKYKEFARYMSLEDIRIPNNDKRFKDIPVQNKIRTSAFQKRFSWAIKQLNDLIYQHGSCTTQDVIAKTLLQEASRADAMHREHIIDLIKEKDYEEIERYLMCDRYSKCGLKKVEECVARLAKVLMEIKESKKVPILKSYSDSTLFNAIDANDYTTALSLCEEFNRNSGISNDKSAIYLLLSDICTLIKSLNTLKEVIEEKAEVVVEDNKPKVTFSSVVSYLMKNDIDNAFISLRAYMKSINMDQYEFLIINLIKISLLEKDIAFTKPMTVLSLMSRGEYIFDVSNYIQEFYITLSQNRLEEAKIYLDIVSKANELKSDPLILDGLYQLLDISLKTIDDKKESEVLSYNQEEEKDVSTFDEEEESSEEKLILSNYEKLLKRRGIIILDPMDSDEIDNTFTVLKAYPDVAAFTIGVADNRRIVLRYRKREYEYVDVKSIVQDGNVAFTKKRYNECIEKYLYLLEILPKPRAFIYSELGLSYMKMKRFDLAIDYLTIATELAKREGGKNLDYTALITRLRDSLKSSDKEQAKPKFDMKEEEFNYDDVDDFYGLENFDELDKLICDSGMDVENACKEIGLDKETTNIIKLIYAREFYMHKEYDRGDLFLFSVEKSKDKTKKVMEIFKEIKKNRLFYQNRVSANVRQLKLSLVPKK